MKKNKALLILLGVLIVLLAAYFALKAWNRQQSEKDEVSDAVVVTQIDRAEFMAIS